MHLVGFIIRIYHEARSPERQALSVSVIIEAVSTFITVTRPFKAVTRRE